MSLVIIQPSGGPDVTRRNGQQILYVKGDDVTDGSIRIIFDDNDDISSIQRRTGTKGQPDDRDWGETGFLFSSSSISLGRDMIVSATSGFIETTNPSQIVGHQKALIPHIQFNDLGTTEPHTPVAGPQQTVPIISNPVGQVVGTTISQVYNLIPSSILNAFILLAGTLSASSMVTVKIFIGTDNTGFLADKRNLAPNELIAGQPVVVNYANDFGFEAANAIFLELTSATSFSLQVDAIGELITTLIGHELRELELLGLNQVIKNDAGQVIKNDSDFVIFDYFKAAPLG